MVQKQWARALIVLFILLASCGVAAAADTIMVNTTGWWKDGEEFNPAPGNPILAALQNAAPDSTVTVVEVAQYPVAVTFNSAVQNGILLDLGGATLDGTSLSGHGIGIEDGKTGITVKNGMITGYTNGILMTGTCSNLQFENVTVSDSTGIAIHNYGSVTNLTIRRAVITNAGGTGFDSRYTGATLDGGTITDSLITNVNNGGILISNHYSLARDILVDNVTVTDAGESGVSIDLQYAYVEGSRNITVRNSRVTNALTHGFYIQGRDSVVFENNTAMNCGDAEGEWGLYLTGVVADTPLTVDGPLQVIGNRNGAFFRNFKGPATFQGDTIRENQGIQFQIEGCSDFTLKDMAMTKPPASTFTNGIFMTGTCSNLQFENVTISDSTGIAIHNYGSVTNLTIRRAVITNAGATGFDSRYTGATLDGATITDSLFTNVNSVGIFIQDHYGLARDILVDNVTVTDAGESGVYIAPIYVEGSRNITVRNSTVTGARTHGFYIQGRNSVAFENNTAMNCGDAAEEWGMWIMGISADTPLSADGPLQVIGNRNGAFFGNFKGPATFRNVDIRENQGTQFQVDNCADITLKDPAMTKPPANTFTNGILLSGTSSSNLRFENISISDSTGSAIQANGPVTNLTIDRGAITNAGTSGIYFDDYQKILQDISLNNITVTNAGSTGVYISHQYQAGSRNITIRNTTVTGAHTHGFQIQGRNSVVFENNTAMNCGDAEGEWGLYLMGYDNPALSYHANTFQENTRGNYIYGITGNYNESTFADTATDLEVVAFSAIDAYNTTFDRAKTQVGDTSVLNAFWFLDLTIVDSDLNPVPDASVTITNASGSTILSGVTGPDGTIPGAWLNEWTKNATASTFHTPFLLHAEEATRGVNDTYLDLDHSMAFTQILPYSAPVVNFSANLTTGPAPLDVGFNDTSSGSGILSYGWIFSDDPFSVFTGRNVTHTFAAGGIYDVNHSVTNPSGTFWMNRTAFIQVTSTSPGVTTIMPGSGFTGTQVTGINITGSNFLSPAVVNLTRTGQQNITATGVTVQSATRINCTFDLAGAPTGQWNVVVTNPDGQSGMLGNGFEIKAQPAIRQNAVFRPSALNNWIFTDTLATVKYREHHGLGTDIPMVGDFNNDGVMDRAMFRNGQWIVDFSMGGVVNIRDHYGIAGDVPLVGDFNNDGITDRAVFRRSAADNWIVDYSLTGTPDYRDHYGISGDIPLLGDVNNDGVMDRAVFRKGEWIVDYSMNGHVDARDFYGIATDVPLIGDFNNDGITDRAVFRKGEWIIDYGFNGSIDWRPRFGTTGDIPLAWVNS